MENLNNLRNINIAAPKAPSPDLFKKEQVILAELDKTINKINKLEQGIAANNNQIKYLKKEASVISLNEYKKILLEMNTYSIQIRMVESPWKVHCESELRKIQSITEKPYAKVLQISQKMV